MNKFCCILMIILSALSSRSQNSRYVIQLKDKQGSIFSINQPSAFLSAKAIERRARQKIPIDLTDIPVSKVYIDSIEKIPGITVINTSKWLNNILVEVADSSTLIPVNAFPFVVRSDKVSFHNNAPHQPAISGKLEEFNPINNTSPACEYISNADTLNYGVNSPQVHVHEGEYLHNLNFRGQGMTIAMLDAGYFNYKLNPAFDSVRMNNRVMGEYDFVNNETSVNEDDVHGANCFSILAANRPGFIVGTAPNANYWLFKTEDPGSERPVEEQYWAAAAERADSVGVDMISSSLGYANFDNPAYNIPYSKRDGKTSPITMVANLAAKKGMIVMVSAGNSGQQSTEIKYVMVPADGDSVVAVGSIDINKVIAPGSSWGPNSSGHTKPNIVSVGRAAVFADPSGNPTNGNGTSYSNPNVAGLILCLWQAFTDFTNMEIIDAVQRSSDHFENPDLNRFGYGIPNFRIAFEDLKTKRLLKNATVLLGNSYINVLPNPFNSQFSVLINPG
ncbi:MAG: S8 family serine peptidase, partial [Flavitalea sp.]